MNITKRTRTKAIIPLLNDERLRKLVAKVPPVPLKKPLLHMTCGEFIEALDERFALNLLKARRALVALGRYRKYMDELKAITAYIDSFRAEQTEDEKKAAQGVNFPSLQERILIDSVKYYGLQSTEAAERLPIADWLLVVKAEGSEAQYQRRHSAIIMKKK